jgi:uncharacterized protein (TIGR02246 family)
MAARLRLNLLPGLGETSRFRLITLQPEVPMQSRLPIATGLVALSFLTVDCAPKPAGERRNENAIAAAPAAAARTDTTAAVAAIRKNDDAFFAAVKGRDAKAAAMLYAPDATSMPANSPPLVGRDAIEKYNQEFLKLPKLTMTGESQMIIFSDDGTMAYDAGKYSVSFADSKGHTVTDAGKFLNVFRPVNGEWKVVIDAFSSNQRNDRPLTIPAAAMASGKNLGRFDGKARQAPQLGANRSLIYPG